MAITTRRPRVNSAAAQRVELRAGLERRRPEIEQAVLARISDLPGSVAAAGSRSREELLDTISACLEFALATLDGSGRDRDEIPAAALAQSRLAARAGIGLDVVLRRYIGGYSLLSQFVLSEAEQVGASSLELKELMREQSIAFDELVATVAAAYGHEVEIRHSSGNRRRLQQVRRLLNGESVQAAGLGYALDGFHLAVVATGPGVAESIRRLARSLGRQLLLVGVDDEIWWAWLGGPTRIAGEQLSARLDSELPGGASAAMGEAASGLEGFRLSHGEAKAALRVARKRRSRVVHYPDVALVSAALADDLLARSLRARYLRPLEEEGDGGRTARETLRAYLAAGCNVSSAAAALKVSRQTVTTRVRRIENRLGVPLGKHLAEIGVALDLHGAG
jgi:DNA-binding CsgD family transcriptional regulator